MKHQKTYKDTSKHSLIDPCRGSNICCIPLSDGDNDVNLLQCVMFALAKCGQFYVGGLKQLLPNYYN